MQEPIRATEIGSGYPFAATSAAIRETGRARSGVCGPTMCGSSFERSISMTWSKYFAGSFSTSGSAVSR